MKKNIIIKGQKFNRLTIIKEVFNNKPNRQVELICDCGIKTIQDYSKVKNGIVKSCGCYNREMSSKRQYKHGGKGTRLYNIWKDMRRRCNNPNRKNYYLYGGKGVTVCEEWNSFENFRDWATKNNYSEILSIDRIDSNGNYEPKNCRWADSITQNRNTSNSKMFKAISPNGDVYLAKVQSKFAEEHGLKPYCISSCLNGKQKTHKGWKFEKL